MSGRTFFHIKTIQSWIYSVVEFVVTFQYMKKNITIEYYLSYEKKLRIGVQITHHQYNKTLVHNHFFTLMEQFSQKLNSNCWTLWYIVNIDKFKCWKMETEREKEIIHLFIRVKWQPKQIQWRMGQWNMNSTVFISFAFFWCAKKEKKKRRH